MSIATQKRDVFECLPWKHTVCCDDKP